MAIGIVSLQVEDGEERRYTIPFYFDTTEVTTLAIAQTLATELGALVDALIGGKVKTTVLTYPLTTAAFTASAASRVDAGATLSFGNTTAKGSSVYVPSFENDFMIDGDVDATDADVIALVDAISAGTGLSNAVRLLDRNGIQLSEFRHGKASVRKT